jgi:hypothetical protein
MMLSEMKLILEQNGCVEKEGHTCWENAGFKNIKKCWKMFRQRQLKIAVQNRTSVNHLILNMSI